ncbi:MAG: metal-dependent hydrolase [Bacilli bacterium]
MDTGTHFVMGITLGGVALASEHLTGTSQLENATMLVAIVSSQIPDIDTVAKLKNNAVYIRNHRGMTHSLPALLLWPLLIAGLIYLFVDHVPFLPIWLLAQVGVFIHIGIDIFNAYGTQALSPLSKKWLALGILPTFDPYIFAFHSIAIASFFIGAPIVIVSSLAFVLTFLYITFRTVQHERIKTVLSKKYDAHEVLLSPSPHRETWHVVMQTDTLYLVGYFQKGIFTEYTRERIEQLPLTENVRKCLTNENIQAFLSFSPVHTFLLKENETFFELIFYDLRYYQSKHKRYPFVAICRLNKETGKTLTSYTGWIFSDSTLEKKLHKQQRKYRIQ